MANKQLARINIDGVANLLLEFAEAQIEKKFTDEEFNGVIKFMTYLIEKWDGDNYVN